MLNCRKSKIGIITYHGVINNGAVLQARGLQEKLQKEFPEKEVEFINYFSNNLELYELLKCFKLFKKHVFFNLKRYLIFKRFIPKFLNLSSKKYFGSLKRVVRKINKNYRENDLIICGSDCIWKLSNSRFLPQFPNIYWLPSELKAKKYSYAVSAYRYDKKVFLKNKEKIKTILNSYNAISVRDADTFSLVECLDLRKEFFKVPDPAFFYEIKKTNVLDKLKKNGIDITRPTFALITSYHDKEIKNIITFFRSKGFQIIGLSMYNPLVDFNLGSQLTPEEWAEVFKYINFCVTDRFHGAIFCIKNKTPFITIETKNIRKERSKKYQLLNDFELLDCYADLYLEKEGVLDRYERIISNWSKYSEFIVKNLDKQIKIGDNFIQKIKNKI